MANKQIVFTCPTCQTDVSVDKPEDLSTRPFCSERCKMVDLHKWFSEEYRISDPIPADIDLDELDAEDYHKN